MARGCGVSFCPSFAVIDQVIALLRAWHRLIAEGKSEFDCFIGDRFHASFDCFPSASCAFDLCILVSRLWPHGGPRGSRAGRRIVPASVWPKRAGPRSCGRARLDLGRVLQEFRRAGSVFVSDMSRDGSPRGPKDRDIVRVAEAENDVWDQVRRHHEIGEGA